MDPPPQSNMTCVFIKRGRDTRDTHTKKRSCEKQASGSLLAAKESGLSRQTPQTCKYLDLRLSASRAMRNSSLILLVCGILLWLP